MRGRGEDGRPGHEAEAEKDVLPMPYVVEKRALWAELEQLDGTWTDGPPSIIAVPRPGGGHVFLSGRTILFTSFAERAYVLGAEVARRLVQTYPAVLEGAEVVVKDRRCFLSASPADHRGEGRSAAPRWRPRNDEVDRGRSASGSAENSAHDPGEHGEGQDRHAETQGEQD